MRVRARSTTVKGRARPRVRVGERTLDVVDHLGAVAWHGRQLERAPVAGRGRDQRVDVVQRERLEAHGAVLEHRVRHRRFAASVPVPACHAAAISSNIGRGVQRPLGVDRARRLEDERLRGLADRRERRRRGRERRVVEPLDVQGRELEGGAELAQRGERPRVVEGEALLRDPRQVGRETLPEARHGVVGRPPPEVPREQRTRHRAQLVDGPAHEPVDAHELGEERQERRDRRGASTRNRCAKSLALERVVAGVVEVPEAAAREVEVAG